MCIFLALGHCGLRCLSKRHIKHAAGIVDKPADLDIATVMAMGFPPYRGGLIFWADLLGAGELAGPCLELGMTAVHVQKLIFQRF
jgi:hypothetical protein